jgi:hypothetical protein
MTPDKPHQPYDNLLKRLVENQPKQIIPLLFPGLVGEVLEELNVEVLLPPRRMDRVYKTRPEASAAEEILHLEFEVTANGKMDVRLLIYHALLLEKHELPITSWIVYPFETSVVTPPLKEYRGTREILSFEYETLPLWKLDARVYVEQHAVPLYGLLPTMQGINDELLLQAIDEMVEYYRDLEAHLRDELLCFRVLLGRAQRLPEDEMMRVERRIRMFDPLLEDDPWVKEKVAESEARGIAKGKAEEARETLVRFVQRRFPSLADTVRAKAASLHQIETLNALMEQLWFASDEYAARALLEEERD